MSWNPHVHLTGVDGATPKEHLARMVTIAVRRCSFAFLIAVLLFLFTAGASAAEPSASAGVSEPGQLVWKDFVEADFPFFSSVLDVRTPGIGAMTNNLTPRGIILNLGNNCWACFDTDLLRMSAIWTGQGVTPVSMAQGSYHIAGVKAPEGQENLPRPLGTTWLANGIYPGWQVGEKISLSDPREPGPDPREVGRGPLPASAGQFKAIRLVEGGVRLEYDVAGVSVNEYLTARVEEGQPVVQRRFHLQHVPQPLWLILGRKPLGDSQVLKLALTARQTDGEVVAERTEEPGGLLAVRVHSSKKSVELDRKSVV